jgi:hypothetical protein
VYAVFADTHRITMFDDWLGQILLTQRETIELKIIWSRSPNRDSASPISPVTVVVSSLTGAIAIFVSRCKTIELSDHSILSAHRDFDVILGKGRATNSTNYHADSRSLHLCRSKTNEIKRLQLLSSFCLLIWTRNFTECLVAAYLDSVEMVPN